MSTTRNVLGICDVCGFRYKLRELKMNSYGLMVCPMDFEKADLKNHPQNKASNVQDEENLKDVTRRSPMPPTVVTVTDWLPS